MRRRSAYLLLAAILAGAAALYLPTLKYEAIWDTRDFLRKSVLLTQDRPLADAFQSGFIYGQFGMNTQSMYYRPLVTLSFMLEKRFWGLSPATLRATNVAIFLCLVVLVFAILCTWGATEAVALTATALFAASPINPGNVVWVVGRGDLLMLLWGMLSLILLRRRGHWGPWTLPAAWAAFLLAILSKETALVFIPLFWLADPPGTTWKERFHHMGFLAISGGYLLIKHVVLHIGAPRLLFSSTLLDYPVRGLAVLGHYTETLLLPFNYPLFNFVSEVEAPRQVIIGAIAVLVLTAASIRIFRPGENLGLRLPLAMTGVFLLPFILLGFTSMWPFRLSTRYMMAASVGFFWLTAMGLQRLPPLLRRVAPGALLLFFIPSVLQHNFSHKTEMTYWQRALADHPGHPAIVLKLAETHYMRENDLVAYALLQRNRGKRVRRITAMKQHLLLAKIEVERLDYPAALRHLKAAEPLDPQGHLQAELLLARIAACRGKHRNSLARLQALIRRSPHRPEAHVMLHRILTGRGNWPAAAAVERRARRILGTKAAWDTPAMARRFRNMPPREQMGFFLAHYNPGAAATLFGSLDLPDNLDNRLFAAWIDFQAGLEASATERIRQTAAAFPKPEGQARIGRFFLDHMQRPATALTWYRRALKQKDDPEWRALAAHLESLLPNDK